MLKIVPPSDLVKFKMLSLSLDQEPESEGYFFKALLRQENLFGIEVS